MNENDLPAWRRGDVLRFVVEAPAQYNHETGSPAYSATLRGKLGDSVRIPTDLIKSATVTPRNPKAGDQYPGLVLSEEPHRFTPGTVVRNTPVDPRADVVHWFLADHGEWISTSGGSYFAPSYHYTVAYVPGQETQ